MTRLAGPARAAFTALALLLASCSSGGTGQPQCGDGMDNDDDGLIDEADPACAAGGTSESDDPPASCADGLDNDGDGKTDFPGDPGCESATDQDEYNLVEPDCMNGVDDDGDGKIDFPNDPGCRAANQDGETDDCPTGANCPECANGQDDDHDGLTDFPADPGCTSASAAFEYNLDAAACGTGTMVAELPANGMASGTIGSGASNVMAATCAGTVGAGAEAAFAFLVEEASTLVATTNGAGTTFDTVLYVRRACRTASTEVACSDDMSATNNKSTLTAELEPGAYFLIVDAKAAGQVGNFTVQATFYNGRGETCTGAAQCAPGYECRAVTSGGAMTCERPVCSDGRDDDTDGKTDYPNDPGCTSATDATETDDCPSGPGCPDCADTVDNDGDGQVDYPAETACASASGTTEYACITMDAVRPFTGNLTAQASATLANDLDLSCGTNGRDEVYSLRVTRPLAELHIDTIGSTTDTSVALKQANCASLDLQCDDDGAGSGDSRVFQIDVAVGEYFIVVDDENSTGTYNLNVRGVLANGSGCDPTSAIFQCGLGYACQGATGQETCTPAACNDAVDDDGDGDGNGYPTDPGCASPSDPTEDDDCPSGTGCAACSNHLDDDGDGFIDYGADPGCAAAGTGSELAPCTSGDPVVLLTNPALVGASTAGHTDDFALSCGFVNGRDDVYRLMVTRPVASLTIDTIGSAIDTVLAVRNNSCGATDLACDDDAAGNLDSRVTLTNVGVGEYFVIVDDRGAATPTTYNLNVTATVAAGAPCDPASTVITCTGGYACKGTGATTCQLAACNDQVDDDGVGDGTGYPNDPGCLSRSDDTEADDCPTGATCPACSNDRDDDGDGLIDYGQDLSCDAASVNSELAPCTSTDTVPVFTENLTGVTFVGRGNDVDLSCGGDGRDMVYRYNLSRPLVSLTVDTGGSDTNTAVAIRRSTCNGTTDLACGVNNFANGDARATATAVTPGEYFILVDDLNTTTPTVFNLNVSGVLPATSRCEPGSTSFVCEVGTSCAGTAGAEICVPAACNDAIDGDGNGDGTGYPTDPGCTDISDNDESDPCPGEGCPACSNGADDDGDGMMDYPADFGCMAASATTETACAMEPDQGGLITTPVTMGTTAGGANNFTPSCQASSNLDKVYFLNLPVPVASLTVSTVGTTFDTVLMIDDATCGSTLACNDDGAGVQSTITQTNMAAGPYAIVVDGWSTTNNGPFTLNVRGTVATGTACTHALFTGGVLACPTGTTCNGTCQ